MSAFLTRGDAMKKMKIRKNSPAEYIRDALISAVMGLGFLGIYLAGL